MLLLFLCSEASIALHTAANFLPHSRIITRQLCQDILSPLNSAFNILHLIIQILPCLSLHICIPIQLQQPVRQRLQSFSRRIACPGLALLLIWPVNILYL